MSNPSSGKSLEKSVESQVPARYRRNLLLLVLFLILLSLWFQRHLRLYVAEVLLLGGTITLWSVWQIVQSWLKWGWKDETKEPNRRLLSHARATEYLLFGFFLLAVLWSTTSSVYVVYEGARTQPAYKVDVLREEHLFLPPLDVTSYDRTAGRPFFLHWRTLDLEFRIVEPYGYESRSERLAPWSSIYLRVPADFSLKKFRVVRFVPLAMYQDLPPLSVSNPSVSYSLRLHRGSVCSQDPVGGQEISDLHRQTVYIGESEEDIRWLLKNRDAAQFDKQFANDLARHMGLNEERRAEWIREWEAEPRLIAGYEFSEGETICLQVWRKSSDQDRKIRQMDVTLRFPESFCPVYLKGDS